ncbi:MAG TPA: redoxin domain-containing protein [Acidobacteriaceae bacterium]|jgi:thiol-disulfide isomerase/thioredoxin|nr:redoxin domain-containing protein [Acidobacteriaceae bacterium]
MFCRFLAVMLLWVPAVAFAAQPFAVDLQGQPIERLAPPGAKAVVLFFVASDCPISNRYIPEIERLQRAYDPDGVRFLWVYPNPADTATVVRAHDTQFDITADTLLDVNQRLTAMAHATITPEVAILVPAASGWREVYRGRIDDRYIALGQERPHAMKHDLELAIRAVLADRHVPPPGGPTVGCSIVPRNEP